VLACPAVENQDCQLGGEAKREGVYAWRILLHGMFFDFFFFAWLIAIMLCWRPSRGLHCEDWGLWLTIRQCMEVLILGGFFFLFFLSISEFSSLALRFPHTNMDLYTYILSFLHK
jgi:hypothetical protein